MASALFCEFVMIMSGLKMMTCSSFIDFEILKSPSLSSELKFIPPATLIYSAPISFELMVLKFPELQLSTKTLFFGVKFVVFWLTNFMLSLK